MSDFINTVKPSKAEIKKDAEPQRVHLFDLLHVVVLLDDKDRLTKPYKVRLDLDEFEIPEGFETDYSSVPRLPVVYLWLGGRGKRAAVVHDYIYRQGRYPQSVCDDYFYLLLRYTGVDRLSAWAFLRGLRIGGFKAYEKYAMARKEVAKQV